MNKGSVIWITGLSGAGKTSVGKIISETLSNTGANVFWMDGDEMRKTLGNKWGYSTEERTELAHVYSRIAAKMAENGIIVICSVVALFNEVRQWNRENIENYFEVYLRVPLSVLVERDTKGHYKKFLGKDDPESVVSSSFQMPCNPDVIVDNFGLLGANESAHHIIEQFLSARMGLHRGLTDNRSSHVKYGIKEYWDSYYSKSIAPSAPSSFAEFCKQKYMEDNKIIFELGCGNGRDSFFFSQTNSLFSIDASETAIGKNQQYADENNIVNIRFMSGFFGDTELLINEKVDYFYSRFVLHAMDEEFESSVITLSSTMLNPDGLFFAEFRTIKDPLSKQGVSIGENERITDHYRRFIDASSIIAKLSEANFEILYSIESNGLAVYKEDDPVVARIVARRLP
ncbi:MAG: adenylyl-sulfate kinase [Methylococcaceae bacterium]|nr:adenylyl-sulfate kinase [Methylococcaceae bacterium]